MDAFLDAAANLPVPDSHENDCRNEMASSQQCFADEKDLKIFELQKKLQELKRVKENCKSGLCQMGLFDISCKHAHKFA